MTPCLAGGTPASRSAGSFLSANVTTAVTRKRITISS